MSGGAVEVHQVPRGSIIVLRNIDAPGDVLATAISALQRVCGHDEFLVITTSDGGDVEVLGPDQSQVAGRLAELLAEAVEAHPLDDDDDGVVVPEPIVGVPGPPPVQLPQPEDRLSGKRVLR